MANFWQIKEYNKVNSGPDTDHIQQRAVIHLETDQEDLLEGKNTLNTS